ncbi:MAG: DUF5034 domain-containing protein [Chitinophagaceae bacterium]|nr:DUF5034 domain-containing protein [Chitinophagaceae bacterium]
MKRIVQKSILIGIGYYLLVLVNACCNCKAIKHSKYRFTGIFTQNTQYAFAADSFTSTLSNADTFRNDTYGFELHFAYQMLARCKPDVASLVASAYACKCETDSLQADSHIKELTIRTVHDFDSQHPAGSDVTDLFYYTYFSRNPYKLYYTDIKSRLIYMTSMDSGNEILYIPCYLKSYPTAGTLIQFEVTAIYFNKEVHKTTTKPIVIQ